MPSTFPGTIDVFKQIPSPTTTPTSQSDALDDTLSARLQQHSDAIVSTQTYVNTSDSVNVLKFGADRTGVSDSTSAINSAIASVNISTGGTVFFPSGTYRILSAISFTLGVGVSICIVGAGQDVTVLSWPNTTNGFDINFPVQGFPAPGSGCTIRDMALVTGSSSIQGIALAFLDPNFVTGSSTFSSNVYNCTFRGTTLGRGWAVGIYFDRVPQTNVYNCLMYGATNNPPWSMVGIDYIGSSAAINTQFTVFGLTTFFTTQSISCQDYVQGLMMTGCSFTACVNGVYVNCPAALQYQFSLFNSQINSTDACIRLNNVSLCNIIGNVLTSAYGGVVNSFGIVLSNCNAITIMGNTLIADGAVSGIYQGITVITSAAANYPIVIDGNTFGSPMNYGVVIDASSTGVTVGRSNAFGPGIYRILNNNSVNNLISGPHLSSYSNITGNVVLNSEGSATIFVSANITGNATIIFDGLEAGAQLYLRIINISGAPHTLGMACTNPAFTNIIAKIIGSGELDLLHGTIPIPNGGLFHFTGMSDGANLLSFILST